MVSKKYKKINPVNIKTKLGTFLLKKRMRPNMKEIKLKRMVKKN